jgi:copper resistance protein B
LAELQGLYSRAVARYTDLQVGVRHDFEPKAERTYATVGFESQFPYWFDVEAAAFLSDRGDLIARLEGTYDLRLTQRVVLQPQAEVKLSAQRVPDLNLGSGLTHAELGLRLRYEIRREFAPYIGVAYERAFGTTADYLRAAGEDVRSTTFVIGLRAWF